MLNVVAGSLRLCGVGFFLFAQQILANPYTLEHSLTGEETVRLSGHVYEFEVGWGASEPEEIDSRKPYTLLDPVLA